MHFQRYLVAGMLTIVPLWITWVVFEFILKQLASIGRPWVRMLSAVIRRQSPEVADWILQPTFLTILAVLVTLVLLYLLGWIATRVLGRKILRTVESLFRTVPFIDVVYGSIKKLVAALQQKPEGIQRVVLINFPSPELKTIGLVTRVMEDADSGEKLAAVYVPTTPNPTSGYMEVARLDDLVPLDWSLDQAMSFIMSGGAVAPEAIHYHGSPRAKAKAAETTNAGSERQP